MNDWRLYQKLVRIRICYMQELEGIKSLLAFFFFFCYAHFFASSFVFCNSITLTFFELSPVSQLKCVFFTISSSYSSFSSLCFSVSFEIAFKNTTQIQAEYNQTFKKWSMEWKRKTDSHSLISQIKQSIQKLICTQRV